MLDNIGGSLIIDCDGAGMTRDQYQKSGIDQRQIFGSRCKIFLLKLCFTTS